MAVAIVDEAVASYHNARICKCHSDVIFIHYIAYRQALREVTAHFRKGLRCTSLSFILSFCQLACTVITVITLQPAIIIGSCANSGGKCKVWIAVAGNINTVHAVTIYLAQQLFHLSETGHAADMGYLHRNVV